MSITYLIEMHFRLIELKTIKIGPPILFDLSRLNENNQNVFIKRC